MIRRTSFAAVPEWVITHPAIRKTPSLLMTYCALYLEGNYKDRTCSFEYKAVMMATGFEKTKVYDDVARLAKAEIIVPLGGRDYWLPLDQLSATAEYLSATAEKLSATAENPETSPITNTEVSENIVLNAVEGAFDTLWKTYPRKVGKADALRAYRARLKEGATPEQLLTAVKAYAKSREGEDEKFTMHPSTFLGTGERWVEFLVDLPEPIDHTKAALELELERERIIAEAVPPPPSLRDALRGL